MQRQLHAALYLRSSKDRSDASIDAQRRELTALAAQRGLVIVAEFVDEVESAKTELRPGFQRLVAELKSSARGWTIILAIEHSRIMRERYAAYFFDRECARRGVRIVYSKVPDVDPISTVILDSFHKGWAEVHSLMSKTKGLAGMAENVRQGFRAGGAAPFGYRLRRIGTGTMREGAEVEKSKLEPDENSHQIGRYLKLRAAGELRMHAAADAGLKKSATTLIGIEWNALTYAGCTAWNVHAEREGGATVGGRKRRPRSEWLIHEGTHPALITREEAERILRRLETSRFGQAVSRGKAAASQAVLSGLLRTPAGEAWHSDGRGSYRVQGRRAAMSMVDQGVQEMFFQDLRAPAFLQSLARQARIAADGDTDPARELRLEVLSLNAKIARTMELAGQMQKPAAALRHVDELEARREAIAGEISRREAEYAKNRALAVLTEENIRALLEQFIDDMQTDDRQELKRVLAAFVERIELDPASLECRIHYRIPVECGESLASPRDSEGFPALVAVSTLRAIAAGRRRHGGA